MVFTIDQTLLETIMQHREVKKHCDRILKEQSQFRKLLKYCSPAMYINKGQAATPAEMQERVDKVVTQLLRQREREGEASLW